MSTGIMIIGPSGSGKTTLGKIVAQKLGYPYFDVDDHIHRCIHEMKRLAD